MSVLYMTLLEKTRRDIGKSRETSSKDVHKKKAPAHLMGAGGGKNGDPQRGPGCEIPFAFKRVTAHSGGPQRGSGRPAPSH